MMETLDNFFNRIYVNFSDDKVFVYPKIRGKHKAEKWSIKEAKEYINYLESEEIVV